MTTLFLASVGLVSLAIVAGSGIAQSTFDRRRAAQPLVEKHVQADASANASSDDWVMAQAIRASQRDREKAAPPARRPR